MKPPNPAQTNPPVPWSDPIAVSLDNNLSQLDEYEFEHLRIKEDRAFLSGKYYYCSFCFDEHYASVAIRKLLKKFPEHRETLLQIAIRNGYSDIWNEVDEVTRTKIMAEVLGSKNE